MRISVVTVCFNSAATIRGCIDSVQAQTFREFEHIIIDGGSSDETLEILENSGHSKMIIVSEKDEGIYHAMNKGVRLSSGDVIHFLNSDDYYANNSVLQKVHDAFLNNAEIVIGDVDYGTNGKPNVWRVSAPSKMKIALGWHPSHQDFCKRSLFEEYGFLIPTFQSLPILS